ncbi:hypothetical protein ANCCEY_08588, partial [Ancylostoma ceylanicum]
LFQGNFEGEIEGGLEDDFVALAGGLAEPVPKSQVEHREPARDGPRREIDDRFDQLLEADYHDDQLGELDGDDFTMGGALEPNDERVKRMIKESHAGPVDDEEYRHWRPLHLFCLLWFQASKEWTRQRLRLIEAKVIKDDEDMETVEVDESASKRLKWDCESYATQYSNIYNHPTLIQNPKSGKLSRRALKRLDREAQKVDEMEVDDEEMQSNDDDTMSQCTQASTYRPKGETPEQRRLRKQAIKEARRFRRQEKKGNKMAFAEEHRKVFDSVYIVAKERAGQIKTVPIV